MAFDPVSAALEVGGKLIDRLWPNPAERDKAKLELMAMQQSGELARMTQETELAKGQMAVNTAEAGNPRLFVSGWRPFIGWVCGVGLAYQFFVSPIGMWAAQVFFDVVVKAPSLDMGDLLTLLFGMLGLGGLRTFEKTKGVAS